MLASPNAGFFTDDGDQSGPPGQGVASGEVPEGRPASSGRWPAI